MVDKLLSTDNPFRVLRNQDFLVSVNADLALRLLMVHTDVDFVLELTNDPDWIRFIGNMNINTKQDANNYIFGARNSFQDNGYGLWVVSDKGVPVGLCGFIKRPFLHQPDFGFALLPQARGQRLIETLAPVCFAWLKARGFDRHVSAVAQLDNGASQKVLTNLGFERNGTLWCSALGEARNPMAFYLRSLG